MTRQPIIVSGASGWLGSEILRSAPQGTALGLYRTMPKSNSIQPALAGDLSDSNCTTLLIEQYRATNIEAGCFIHCAGLAHQPDETAEVGKAMWQANDIGTVNALEFCLSIGVKRFIYIGTIAGYDWATNEPNREGSKLAPRSEYAKSKLAGEERVLKAPLDGRVIRLGTVFGSGDQANFLRLSSSLRKRRFPVPGSGSARKSVIPIDTAARLILKFATINEVPHKIINLALPEPPSLSEICDKFSQVCDFPKAPMIPMSGMRVLAKIGDFLGVLRKMPFNTDVLGKLTTSTWVDTRRMLSTFHDEYFESFEASLERHAEYYRSIESQNSHPSRNSKK